MSQSRPGALDDDPVAPGLSDGLEEGPEPGLGGACWSRGCAASGEAGKRLQSAEEGSRVGTRPLTRQRPSSSEARMKESPPGHGGYGPWWQPGSGCGRGQHVASGRSTPREPWTESVGSGGTASALRPPSSLLPPSHSLSESCGACSEPGAVPDAGTWCPAQSPRRCGGGGTGQHCRHQVAWGASRARHCGQDRKAELPGRGGLSPGRGRHAGPSLTVTLPFLPGCGWRAGARGAGCWGSLGEPAGHGAFWNPVVWPPSTPELCPGEGSLVSHSAVKQPKETLRKEKKEKEGVVPG